MSWHDPARSLEPETDSALRNELRGLLGMPSQPANYFETEPNPELVRLAEDLKREARRRNHTDRRRSSWMLLAAALPFALVICGMGYWGLTEESKANHLAAAVAQQQAQIQQLAAAVAHPPAQSAGADDQQLRTKVPASRASHPMFLVGAKAHKAAGQGDKAVELVLPVVPVDRATEVPGATQSVKAHQ